MQLLLLPIRLRDVMFLDLALEMTGRGAVEAGLAAVRAAAPSTLLGGLLALLQQPLASACMSALPGQGGSAALVSVAEQLQMLSQDCPGEVWKRGTNLITFRHAATHANMLLNGVLIASQLYGKRGTPMGHYLCGEGVCGPAVLARHAEGWGVASVHTVLMGAPWILSSARCVLGFACRSECHCQGPPRPVVVGAPAFWPGLSVCWGHRTAAAHSKQPGWYVAAQFTVLSVG